MASGRLVASFGWFRFCKASLSTNRYISPVTWTFVGKTLFQDGTCGVRVFDRKFRNAKRAQALVGSVISSMLFLGFGSAVIAQESKGSNVITSMGSHPDPDYIPNYSTDDVTGLSYDGEEILMSDKGKLGLPTVSSTSLSAACEWAGHKDKSASKATSKDAANSGDVCDNQETTAKIFEAAGKATGIPGAYLMCAMADGSSFSNKDAGVPETEMKDNVWGFKEVWKVFQRNLNRLNGKPSTDDSLKPDSAINSNALKANTAESVEARIFAMGMEFRDALQSYGQSAGLSNVKGEISAEGSGEQLQILNFLVISQSEGKKVGVDFLRKAATKKSDEKKDDNKTSVERCIAHVNGRDKKSGEKK